MLHLGHGASVTGITTLPADADRARTLVADKYPNGDADIYTGTATYTPGRDAAHPLNPERAPKATSGGQVPLGEGGAAQPYDLVYALDVVYHIPPAVMTFASNVFAALKPGGTLAYTDVLPPAKFSSMPWRIVGMWLALPLGVPHRNMIDRPKDLDAYKAQLEHIGYTDVEVQDWSDHVWDGLADNLEKRDSVLWHAASYGFRHARKAGWKFIAVRATKSEHAEQPPQEQEHEHEHDAENGHEEL